MNPFSDLLKSRLLLELAGLAALAALIWVMGPTVSHGNWRPLQPEVNRLLLIFILFVIWVAYKVIMSGRAGKKNKELMTQLSMPAASTERDSIEEAQSEESAVLRQRFEESLQLLAKSHSGGKAGRAFLYSLPWYLIIGGPGVGKTTLIFNSGLKFPLSDQKAVKGVGGTRNCDWFFADDAVFIDTAGRYTTQDSYQPVDKAAWGNFLGLLKKYRPRRPINGLLLAMSMSELMELSEEERTKRARELRQRISELYEVLANRFPVYMVFTKSDLIAGFNDIFSDITQEERSQVWGETFSREGSRQQHEKMIASFDGNFDEVIRRLNHWTLGRIQDERDINRRGAIFCFPQQLSQVKPIVIAFLQDLFVTSRFEKEALLRGVYFTSGTQEGTPIDRIMGVLSNIYGMERQELPPFRGRPKSFFISRLLRDVVLPEAELAGLDPGIERRRKSLRLAAYLLLFLITAGLASLWSLSYYKNTRALAQVEQKIDAYRKIPGQTTTPEKALRAMIARLNALVEAYRVYGDRSWDMGFGLYQGDKLNSGILDVYRERLKLDLLPEIQKRLKRQMGEIIVQRGDSDTGLLYELLRAYLMLATPNRMDAKLAGDTINKLWERGERDYSKEPPFLKQLQLHSGALLKSKPTAPPDMALVAMVRHKIKEVPPATQLYNQLRSGALADHADDFRLTEAVARSKEVFATADGKALEDVSIPGFFTLAGYNNYFRKYGLDLVDRTMKEDWVLEQTSGRSSSDDRLYNDLQDLYFKEYERRWSELLGNLKIKKPSDVYEMITILDYISGQDPDNPLRLLLQAVGKNTNIVASADTKQPGSGEKTSPLASGRQSDRFSDPTRKLAKTFEEVNKLVQAAGQTPPPLDKALKAVDDFRRSVNALTSGARDKEDAALRLAKAQGDSAFQDINRQTDRLPEPLKGWLKTATTSSGGGSATTELAKLWKTEVAGTYAAAIKGRYPIFRDGSDYVTTSDFSRFFAPKGVLDQFFETNLKGFIDTGSTPWRQSTVDNRGIQLSKELLTQLQYAAKIREAFFSRGDSLRIEFKLKPVELGPNVERFTINIEGQTADYVANAPPATSPFQWPGPNRGQGVVLSFKIAGKEEPVSKLEEGDWAWFKVLDQSKLQRISMSTFHVTFQIGGYSAIYELRADSVSNPFGLSELQRFRCPESL